MKVIVNKFYYLDTEFHSTKEEHVTPVCASLFVNNTLTSYVHPQGTPALVQRLRTLHAEGYTCQAYAVEAECRYMQAIGIDPLREGFRFIDLYILYRLLANNFDDIEYGKHLVDGKVRFLKKPPCKWDIPDMTKEEIEEARGEGSMMQYGLASATYKFCNVIRDTDDKDAARKRIIAGGPFTDEEIAWIVRYCEDDTRFLPELSRKMIARYRETIPEASLENLVHLSSYAVHTAEMVRIGYPVNVDWLKKVTDTVPFLISKLCLDLLEKCKELNLDFIPLSYERKTKKFKENQKFIKTYIEANYKHAKRTDKHNVSLEEEALRGLLSPAGEPKKFIDYFTEFRLTVKTIKSFKAAEGKRDMYDYLGSDGRVRPYFGIFGAQTSRSQPSSSGFIFLKSACMRHLVQPKPGKMIVGIDYASQEFLINAVLACDQAMVEAYKSGDPYVYLGKAMGLIPKTGTKDSHKQQRNIAKQLELGLSYGMGANGVAPRIGVTPERARELIDLRADVYHELTDYRNDLRRKYKTNQEVLLLPDGWAHGPDNDNDLSMMNFPTQGHGAVVMREAVNLSHKELLAVIMTLHDALYFEFDFGDWASVDKAIACMKLAFRNICGREHEIRVDTHAWGPDFPAGYVVTGTKQDYHHLKTPQGNTVSYEQMYWDDRVTVNDRDFWHNFVTDTRFDTL